MEKCSSGKDHHSAQLQLLSNATLSCYYYSPFVKHESINSLKKIKIKLELELECLVVM